MTRQICNQCREPKERDAKGPGHQFICAACQARNRAQFAPISRRFHAHPRRAVTA